MKKDSKTKRGPKAETVKITGDWRKAVKSALKLKRPADGWPESKKDR